MSTKTGEVQTPKEFSEGVRNSSSLSEKSPLDEVWPMFSARLKACSDYPFDESQDYHLLGWAMDYCPDIDVLAETKKKMEWWENHPGALSGRKGKHPRVQLQEFFEWEQKYQEFKKTTTDSRGQEEYF